MITRTATYALLIGLIGISCSSIPVTEPKTVSPSLMVFAAASLSDVLPEVGTIYENQSKEDLVFNFAGTNLLAQQILASSKADIFVSANEKWMDTVERAGQIEHGTRKTLFSNTLVLVAQYGSTWTVNEATNLCELDFQLLALGNPDAVPAGHYAKQWLETVPCRNRNLWKTIAGRISPTPNVRAVIGQIEATDKILGIVYQTDYIAAKDRIQIIYTIPANEGPPISYTIAQLQNTKNPKIAKSFIKFLFSDTAQIIFKKHGFLL